MFFVTLVEDKLCAMTNDIYPDRQQVEKVIVEGTSRPRLGLAEHLLAVVNSAGCNLQRVFWL
jgi:hypothetical protein